MWACISGPILRGYPGYPFESFVVPGQADSVFFTLQPLLVDEGFPLDYTRLDSRLIATRRSERDDLPLFLSVVVGEEANEARSRVWVAGYESTPTGPLRVNPDNESLWPRVQQVARNLSESLGGTAPTGPDGAPPPPVIEEPPDDAEVPGEDEPGDVGEDLPGGG